MDTTLEEKTKQREEQYVETVMSWQQIRELMEDSWNWRIENDELKGRCNVGGYEDGIECELKYGRDSHFGLYHKGVEIEIDSKEDYAEFPSESTRWYGEIVDRIQAEFTEAYNKPKKKDIPWFLIGITAATIALCSVAVYSKINQRSEQDQKLGQQPALTRMLEEGDVIGYSGNNYQIRDNNGSPELRYHRLQ